MATWSGYSVLYLMVTTWAIYSYSNVFFLFGPYLEKIGFSPETTGILLGAFYAATTLTRPLGGFITEFAGISRALFFSGAICLAAAMFNFVTMSFAPLLLIRIAMGAAFSVFVVALTTYQSISIPEEKRGMIFALVTIGSLACLFTVVPLVDILLQNGHDTLFLAIPVSMAALCVAMSRYLPPAPKISKDDEKWGTWGELYHETPFWRIVASCTMFGLCDASVVSLPALLQSMNLSSSSFFVANGLGALVMRTFGMKFFNTHARFMVAGPSLIVMAVFLYMTTLAGNNVQLFIYAFFYGAGMGYGFPAHLSLVGDLAPARLRSKSSVLVHFCNDSGWFILPVYVGVITSLIGAAGAFRAMAALCAMFGVGLSIMWVLYNRRVSVQKHSRRR
ncbi:hypothetical protein AGMMS50276_32400 [Synergistales bacterium]|nr:hypothetical protein AGMMS50276_32400 [Synergistales bacterium]